MATVVQKNYSDIRPIRFNLRDKDRSLDLNVPNKYASQQGGNFLEYKFLVQANDLKNKNYTTNYLTDVKSEPEIFDLNFDQNINNSFITTLKFDNNSDKYLTILKNNTSLSSIPALSALSASDINTFHNQSFVIDLSSTDTNESICSIWTYDGLFKKYLVQRGRDQTVVPQLIFDTLDSTTEGKARATFNVTLDSNSALISFYGDTSTVDLSAQFIVSTTSNTLTALSGFNAAAIADSAITIENYNTIDTDYSKYSNNFVYYSNGTDVDPVSSLPNQEYNFLFYNNYEENYLSGSDIFGQLSYFNLKNQISNNNNVNKKLPFNLPQQQRYYNSILNNEVEEISEEDLKLGYNFYTAEYTFEPDKYTKFKLPSNITPFKSININDAGFQDAGAFAAGSPYYSDRVYKLQDESNFNTTNEETGTFLCSWLYDDKQGGTWLDRYYLPKYATPIVALTGVAGSPLKQFSTEDRDDGNPYLTQIQEISSGAGLGDSNMYYYDVASTLSLEPNSCYYYARIGKSYVRETLNGLSNKVVKTNLDINSTVTSNIISEQNKIVFDGTVYDKFTFPSLLDADQGSLAISFEVNMPSVSAAKAHQLVGNLYNTGISFVKNFYFTPFTVLQEGNSLYYYDHNFNLVKTNTFNSVSAITDVCYMMQSGDAVLMCESSTGHKILRVNYNGDVVRESSHSLAAVLIDSKYTSRVFYGVGSRARFFSQTMIFNLDLQTLSIDTIATTKGEFSGILSAAGGSNVNSISGFKGINVDGKYAASLSASTGVGAGTGSTVLFTEYATGEQFSAIRSVTTPIWDINAFDDKLYIHSDKLYVFNTDRELLSSINLSTSAVSGYKIDFMSEDYVVNPIVFSRDSNNKLIVDKIITTQNNTVSSYSLGISGVELGSPYITGSLAHNLSATGLSAGVGNFVSPTNLHSVEDTFKAYENKLCFISRFDNEIALQDNKPPWNTYNKQYSAFDTGWWNVNLTGTGATLVDNSSIHLINGIKDGHNCIQADLDLVTGSIRIFVDGVETTTFTVNAGIKPLKNYLYNDFYIGAPNFSTGSIVDYKSDNISLARNIIMSNINVFDTTLDTDVLKYLYLDCVTQIDPVNFDVTTSARNNIETINTLYSYKIPGNLSNKIKLLIKNGNLNVNEQAIIATELRKRVSKLLPSTININDIEFDFRIGNDQPVDEPVPLFLQPSLPTDGSPFSNVFDPGSYISIEVTTDLAPILYTRDGTTAFVMIV